MSQRPVSPSIMNSADNSGPPGHFYVAVASRMVIPQTLNIEQVAIILMKAKKALQQLQFQWVVLNRPASGIGFVMFWDGNELADDGYNWMNRGRTDTIPTHQKSISIEATRFFDGYVPGERVVSMTKTFYRFAGQQTSLYFVHYMSHPVDAPKKPVGPPIPTVKSNVKPSNEATLSNSLSPRPSPSQPARGRPSTSTPPLGKPIITFPANPPLTSTKSSPTTIRLALQSQPPPQQQHSRQSPRRQMKTSISQQSTAAAVIEQEAEVLADFDSWGPVDHAVNRLTRLEAFYQKLFSMTTGTQKPSTNQNLILQGQRELREALSEQLRKTKEELVQLDKHYSAQNDRYSGAFSDLDRVSTPEELVQLARLYNIHLDT